MQSRDYTVIQIEGEYATLRDEDGAELFIALALLPEGADINSRLHFENFEYALID